MLVIASWAGRQQQLSDIDNNIKFDGDIFNLHFYVEQSFNVLYILDLAQCGLLGAYLVEDKLFETEHGSLIDLFY